MPMFYTPKPRQFAYRPRFYNPEKERWEALKQKYADEQAALRPPDADSDVADLEYFERRVRELDRTQRAARSGLTWRDLFRKREMPTFRYQPRFGTSDGQGAHEEAVTATQGRTPALAQRTAMKKIKRRFDVSDTDYMKPVPAGRIMLYALLVCLLLYWILF